MGWVCLYVHAGGGGLRAPFGASELVPSPSLSVLPGIGRHSWERQLVVFFSGSSRPRLLPPDPHFRVRYFCFRFRGVSSVDHGDRGAQFSDFFL